VLFHELARVKSNASIALQAVTPSSLFSYNCRFRFIQREVEPESGI
jgi:hypothetical protein